MTDIYNDFSVANFFTEIQNIYNSTLQTENNFASVSNLEEKSTYLLLGVKSIHEVGFIESIQYLHISQVLHPGNVLKL